MEDGLVRSKVRNQLEVLSERRYRGRLGTYTKDERRVDDCQTPGGLVFLDEGPNCSFGEDFGS